MNKRDVRDVRGGHDCTEHQVTDDGVCAVCHERSAEVRAIEEENTRLRKAHARVTNERDAFKKQIEDEMEGMKRLREEAGVLSGETLREFAFRLAEERAAEQEKVRWLTAEIEVLRGVGCEQDGDGPCGACIKCIKRQRDAAQADAGQLQVQLAGCLTAAEGATRDAAERGAYGWSPAYQAVLDLRRQHDQCGEPASAVPAPMPEPEAPEPTAAETAARIERAQRGPVLPGLADASPTVQRAVAFLLSVGMTLIEKNARYGDSAANPVRIFSRAAPTEQILVRIDDKLARLRSMGAEAQPDEDTLRDLVGYLALLRGVAGEGSP